MKRLLYVILVFTHLGLGAQISISGMINNSDSEAVPYINVLICKPGSAIAIAFAVSNEKGHFQTNVNVDSDSLDIKLSSVNYRNVVRRIPNKSQELQFLLTPEVMELESIIEKVVLLAEENKITSDLLHDFIKEQQDLKLIVLNPRLAYRDAVKISRDILDRHYFELALQITNNNKSKAAKMLGVSLRQFQYKCKEMGL